MKKRGNTIVNKEYNPRNVKPDIPVDVDEADSAMERFIRQKYEHRILEDGKPKPPSRDDSGYHTQKSLDESPPPPPIPPKSGRKFGFGLRSVSSTSRLPRSSDKSSIQSTGSPRSATLGGPLSPSLSLNKQSRVFGANLGEADSSFEAKLDQLRSMGFPNDKRNASVLKGVGGDMTRAVESLIRLGEGSGPPLAAPTAPPKPSTSRSQPTSSPAKTEADDPWSMPSVSSAAGARAAKSYNPFDVPTTQAPAATGLENAFQNLQVAQPMSPHTTGGYTSNQMSNNMALTPLQTSQSYTSSPQPLSYNPFFQTTSPTSQAAANPYYSHTAQSTPIQPSRSFSPGNPFANSLSAQSTGNQQNLAAYTQSRLAMPRHANTMPVFSSNTTASPSMASSIFFSQQPQLSPYQVSNTNPFDAAVNTHNNYQNYSSDHQQLQYQHFQQQNPYTQFQQAAPQQPARADKNSILALYNLAPAATPPMSTIPEQSQVPQMQQPVDGRQNTAQASNSASAGHQPQSMFPTMLQSNSTGSSQGMQNNNPFMNATQQQPQFQPQQSQQTQQSQQQQTNPFAMMGNSTPAAPSSNGLGIGMGAGSHNPYQQMTSQPPPPPVANFMPRAPIHMSKASVDINNLQSGRHSPDAFASLSARFA